MEGNSISLATSYVAPKKKKKVNSKSVIKADFPYKAKSIFGLGGK